MNELDKAMSRAVSRRRLLKGTAAAVVGSAAYSSLFRAAAQEPENVQNILDVTVTVEQFGVTFLGFGIESAEQGNFDMPWPPEVLAIVKAARAQEQFHLDFFESLGGRALVDTFTIPPEALTDFNTFFSALVVQEAVEIAGQLAAIEMFTELNRPDLMKVSFQYAAEEAEHRLLANYTRGARPPNNLAFAPMMFEMAEGMLDSMRQRGLIGGSGMPVAFPGPGSIDATNVVNRTPDGPNAY